MESTATANTDSLKKRIDELLRKYPKFPVLPRNVSRLRSTLAMTKLFLQQTGHDSKWPVAKINDVIDSTDSIFKTICERPLQAFLFGTAYTQQLRQQDAHLVTIIREVLNTDDNAELQRSFETLIESRPGNLHDDVMDHFEIPVRTVTALCPRWHAMGAVSSLVDCDQQLHDIQNDAEAIRATRTLDLSEKEEGNLRWITESLQLNAVARPFDEINREQRSSVLQKIYAADTVRDFQAIYEDAGFMGAMKNLRRNQNQYQSSNPQEWATVLALNFQTPFNSDSELADIYADYRLLRTFLWELYQRCQNPTVTDESTRADFKVLRLDNFLHFPLSIDRAITLHVLNQNWVSADTLKNSKEWHSRALSLDHGATIDHRYIWFAGTGFRSFLKPMSPPQPQMDEAVVVFAEPL